jgi:hypothetical protein
VDAVRSGDQRKAQSPATTTAKSSLTKIRRCALDNLAVTIENRHPRRQVGDYRVRAPKHRRIATVVARNISARRCLLVAGDLHLTIRDRTRKLVAKWLSANWFVRSYPPGFEQTFSLPDTYRCDRPGPYLATAKVGVYTARRTGLSRSDITC